MCLLTLRVLLFLVMHLHPVAVCLLLVVIHPSVTECVTVSPCHCVALWQVWDLREGHLLYTLHGHKGAVLDSRFDAKGEFLASVGADEVVMVWKSNLDVFESSGSHGRGPLVIEPPRSVVLGADSATSPLRRDGAGVSASRGPTASAGAFGGAAAAARVSHTPPRGRTPPRVPPPVLPSSFTTSGA